MHRADQIIDAVVALLRSASVSTQVPYVFPHRTLSMSDEQAELPALCVNFGKDDPVSEFAGESDALIDSMLEVLIDAYLKGDEETVVKRSLLSTRAAVQTAVLNDPTLGLEFVVYTNYDGADELALDSTSSSIVGRLPIKFRVHYRMPATDPT